MKTLFTNQAQIFNHIHLPFRLTVMAVAINTLVSAAAMAGITCKSEGDEVLLDSLPTDIVIAELGLRPAKAKMGDEGKFRLAQKDSKTLFVSLIEDGKKCGIVLGTPTVPTPVAAVPAAAATTPAPTKPTSILDEKSILASYSENLGVPASPAFTLIGVNPIQAALPRAPRDFAAQLVQGRGADGKIKAGIAIDTTLFQLLRIAGLGSETTSSDYQRAGAAARGNVKPDNSHRFANRLKVSIATTEDQQTSPATDQAAPTSATTPSTPTTMPAQVNAANAAIGFHYVFFDHADPKTTKCDGDNSDDPKTKKAINTLLSKYGKAQFRGDISDELQKLRNDEYKFRISRSTKKSTEDNEPKDLKELIEELKPLVAEACALTETEKLEASALMAGWGHSYRLTDGSWGNRESGVSGLWLTYALKGWRLPSDKSVIQAVVHLRSFHNQRIVATTTDAAKSKNTNLVAVRLRAAVPGGAASFEYSVSRDKIDGVRSSTRRSAFAMQYHVTKGVWLVGSAGREISSLTGTKSQPFVLTSLRFGGDQQ